MSHIGGHSAFPDISQDGQSLAHIAPQPFTDHVPIISFNLNHLLEGRHDRTCDGHLSKWLVKIGLEAWFPVSWH